VDGDGQKEVLWGTTGSAWAKLYCFKRDGTQLCTLDIKNCAINVGNTYSSDIRILIAEEGTINLKCYKIVSSAFSLQWTYTGWDSPGGL